MSNPYAAPDDNSVVSPPEDLIESVRGIKIITVALAAGALLFLGIALATNAGHIEWEPNVLSWLAIGIAALNAVLHVIISAVTETTGLRNLNAEAVREADEPVSRKLLIRVYLHRHIVACALLEGAAFFNLVAYMVTHFGGNLVAAAVLISLIAIRLPSVGGVQFWIQDRIREIEAR